jgi:hypothetical protein
MTIGATSWARASQARKECASSALMRGRKAAGSVSRVAVAEIDSAVVAALIDSMRASVKNLVESSHGEIFDTKAARLNQRPIFDLMTARTQQALTYFGVPALLMPTAAKRMSSLIINDIKASLAAETTPYLPCIDELASIGPQVTNLINQGRSYRAICLIGYQTFADLKLPADPNFIHRVIGSVNGFVFHELTDPEAS